MEPTKKSAFATFGIVANAEGGVKFPLLNPATGEETEHWLRLRGTDSPTMQKAEAEADHLQAKLIIECDAQEAAINASDRTQEEKDKALRAVVLEKREKQAAISRKHLAHAVVDWSNCETNEDGTVGAKIPATLENVVAFFVEAPQLQEQIDDFSFNRQNFVDASFRKPSAD